MLGADGKAMDAVDVRIAQEERNRGNREKKVANMAKQGKRIKFGIEDDRRDVSNSSDAEKAMSLLLFVLSVHVLRHRMHWRISTDVLSKMMYRCLVISKLHGSGSRKSFLV